jgi:PIN domain nuclease of toxin-antitoxin system
VTTVLLDTHVVQWWSAEPERLSDAATKTVAAADQLAVAAISWFELAWLAAHERIIVTIPVRSWLEQLADGLQTLGVTPAIAATAVSLPSSFPGDRPTAWSTRPRWSTAACWSPRTDACAATAIQDR